MGGGRRKPAAAAPRCSVPAESAVPGATCYSEEELRRLAHAYNGVARAGGRGKGGGDGEARPRAIRGVDAMPAERLLRELEARLGEACGGAESCWPARAGLAGEAGDSLRLAQLPLAPAEWARDPDAWLSNEDIDAAIESLTRTRADFRYLGAQSVDFDERLREGGRCVSSLCDMGLRDIEASRAALVINMDDHRGPGTHWVALFAVLAPADPRRGFYYYDSTGKRPPARVDRFVERLGAEMREPEYLYNDLVHQSGNTECGMFAINFVVQMLRPGATFERTCERMGRDADMFRLRDKFFVLQRGGGAPRKRSQRKAETKGGA